MVSRSAVRMVCASSADSLTLNRVNSALPVAESDYHWIFASPSSILIGDPHAGGIESLLNSGLGQTDRAFQWLDKAYADHDPQRVNLNRPGDLENLANLLS